MLARLTDKDGDPVWVNPLHVRSVQAATGLLGGHKGTQVMLSGDNVHGHRVFVAQSVSQAAAAINAAMPVISASDLAALTDDDRRRDDESTNPHAS
jgi:hypothetical protein